MGENVPIAGGKDEAGAQLEGILAQFMLAVPGGHGLLASGEIVPPAEVEEVTLPEVRGLVRAALFVDQQGEGDPGVLAEEAGVVGVPQADGGEGGAGLLDLRLVIAQLRDMVAAEDSPVVAQEDQHRGSIFPQRTEANFLAVWIREFNGGEAGTQRVGTHRRNDTIESTRDVPAAQLLDQQGDAEEERRQDANRSDRNPAQRPSRKCPPAATRLRPDRIPISRRRC